MPTALEEIKSGPHYERLKDVEGPVEQAMALVRELIESMAAAGLREQSIHDILMLEVTAWDSACAFAGVEILP
jgi:hypothetical protein